MLKSYESGNFDNIRSQKLLVHQSYDFDLSGQQIFAVRESRDKELIREIPGIINIFNYMIQATKCVIVTNKSILKTLNKDLTIESKDATDYDINQNQDLINKR